MNVRLCVLKGKEATNTITNTILPNICNNYSIRLPTFHLPLIKHAFAEQRLDYQLITIDVQRQTRNFYARANLLIRNFRYCTDNVKCYLFQSYCTSMYCCQLWFNSTKGSLKKLKTSYNSALRRFLVISKPYSASQMFVSRGILSFDELLRKSIYRFVERIENSTNSIIHACLSSSVFLYSPIRKWWSSLLYL